MEISMEKRKSFKYIDFLEFQVVGQTFAVSPTETHYSANEVAFVADEITIKNEPVLLTAELMLGAQLIGVQLCDDSNCEIYLQGDEIFEYLDPVFQIEYGFVHFCKDYSVRQTCMINADGEPVPTPCPKRTILVNGVELSKETAKYLARYAENDENALRELVKELDKKRLAEYDNGAVRRDVTEVLVSFLHCPATYLTEKDGVYEKEFLERKHSDLIEEIAESVIADLVSLGVTPSTIGNGFVEEHDVYDYIDAAVECGTYSVRLETLQAEFEEYMATP